MQTPAESTCDGISYRKRMPLHWTPLAELPSGADAERLAEANTRLLGAVALLEEHVQPSDEPSAHELELVRIHQKLNLLLEMVGGYLTHQSTRPPETMVRLSWRNIAWENLGGSAEIGSLGLVELNLSSILPTPLRLPARIVAIADGVYSAEYDMPSEQCRSAIERHVFMRHRREVAETRQPARQGPREI